MALTVLEKAKNNTAKTTARDSFSSENPRAVLVGVAAGFRRDVETVPYM